MSIVKNFSVRTFAVVVSIIVFMVSVISFNRFTADAVYESRAYYRYNAQTGEKLKGYYKLDSPEDNISTYNVIGKDERKESSQNGVVKLIITEIMDTNDNDILYEQTCVTGFVIDRHTIATAAHCVYNYKVDKILFFDENGDVSMEITDPVEYHVPRQYTTEITVKEGKENDFDYALITVSQDLKAYDCFDMGYVSDKYKGGEVSMTGFPRLRDDEWREKGEKPEVLNTVDIHKMFTGTGEFSGFSGDELKVFYTIDASQGNSGSPVYVTEELYGEKIYTVIAIHTNPGEHEKNNYGKRITQEILRFYNGNPNKQY